MRRGWRSLRDNDGQALVFVALSLGVLIAAAALVVDVGSWFQAKRHAQSVADAAALAAAPQLLDNSSAVVEDTARASAQQDWPNVQVTPTAAGDSIQVVTEPPAGSNLSPFGHFPISINASATAGIQVPAEVNAVVPIVIVCSMCSNNRSPGPWSANPWSDGSPVYVSYTPGTPDANSFSPVQLPGVSSRTDFRNFATCDASTPRASDCNQASAAAPDDRQRLCLRTVTIGPPQNRRTVCRDANRVGSYLSPAIDPTGNELHLVAISSGYSGGAYHIVGWAAAAFTGLTPSVGNNGTVQLVLSFHPLLVDGKWFDESSATGNKNFDFGVRAIALTG